MSSLLEVSGVSVTFDGYKAIRRLPRLFEQVAALQKAVFKSGENE